MKVKFLKQHLSYKKGGEYEVDNGLGNYLVRVKAAEEVGKAAAKEAPAKEEAKEESKPATKTAAPKKAAKKK